MDTVVTMKGTCDTSDTAAAEADPPDFNPVCTARGALLQRESRTDAGRIGVPIGPRHLTVDAIRDAIGRREQVLLLVSLDGMMASAAP